MYQQRTNFEFTLLDPKNRAYVSGQSDRIASNSDWLMVGAGVILATLVGFLFVISGLSLLGALLSDDDVSNLGNRVIITLVMGGGTAFLIYSTVGPFREMFADRRLSSEGQILPGEVTAVTMNQGSYKGMRIRAMRVSYTFKTPQGQSLTGITGSLVGLGSVPPTHGTALGILYMDDTLHKAL
jgi:hypothetical protein